MLYVLIYRVAYEGDSLYGIFDSKEKAVRYAVDECSAKEEDVDRYSSGFIVEDYELNTGTF